ncbi:MAG: BatA domain-containing protein [Candidatus Sumerlaeota bacterium]|nr:BatA domain-containing protein [Candidatus Sumerlaeota bacterium]
MFSIFFAQPWFLFGLAAASLPVLIHLIHRQKRKRLLFSTLRFLVISDRKSARRHQLVDILVLILRTALVALLALALAQPLLRPAGAGADRFGEMSLAIVVDDSMSMRRTREGVALFDKAVEAAKRIVSEIPQSGEACVFLTSGRTPPTLSTPTAPPANLEGLLEGLDCSYGGRTVSPAIHQALDIVSGSKLKNHAIVLISDLGATAFTDAASLNRDALAKRVASVQVLDVGDPDLSNTALTAASGLPSTAFPGTPLSIRATVLGVGNVTGKTLVSFWVGDEKMSEKDVDVEAGKPVTTEFEHVLDRKGDVPASVRLQADNLPADNARYLVFRMLPTVRTAIIAPPGEASVFGDESLFLRTALNPLLTPTMSGASPVTVAGANYVSFRADSLKDIDAVFLIADPSVPPNISASLQQFAEGGGTVVWFPSALMASDPTALAKLQQTGFGGFKVTDLWAARSGESPVGLGEAEPTHPIVNLLLRAAPQLFGAVTTQRYLAVDENSFDQYTRVVARFASGAPFLIERRAGKGGMLVFTTGCHPVWSDFPLRPLFLPLLYETLKYTLGQTRPAPEGVSVDDGFSVAAPEGGEGGTMVVQSPSGMEDRVDCGAGQTKIDYTNTPLPGFYSVRWVGRGTEPELIAVNPSSTESGMERISPEDLKAYFPESFNVAAVREPDKVIQRLSYASKGVALTSPLLWAALVALLLEAYLANLLLRAAEEQPSWAKRLRMRFEEGWKRS